jgi:hypothetical protein
LVRPTVRSLRLQRVKPAEEIAQVGWTGISDRFRNAETLNTHYNGECLRPRQKPFRLDVAHSEVCCFTRRS